MMSKRNRRKAALLPATLMAVFATFCAQATAAETVSPLPASAYSVSPACPPPARDRATCLALRLVPRTAEARAYTHPLGLALAVERTAAPSPKAGQLGLRPQDLHTAYELPTRAPSTQTIALVDSYNDLTAEADLTAYDKEFGLPECTEAVGCFKKVNQEGSSQPGALPFPQSGTELGAAETACEAGEEAACLLVEEVEGWTVETSLDIETAHATCQNCQIVLVESESPAYAAFASAEDTAVELGATEVSNSWGGPECVEDECVQEGSRETLAFEHGGTVITAAAGDDGYLGWDAENSDEQSFADFPASSPDVVAVGGTRLRLAAGSRWAAETVWNGDGAGGGGCSVLFSAQLWQQRLSDWHAVGCEGMRAVADVSADADPYTGVAVRDSSPACETIYREGGQEHHLSDWCTVGGTSLASPIIAGVYALAGGAGGVSYPSRTLYENEASDPGSLHDVATGSNGRCGDGESFDEETGVSECTVSEEAGDCKSDLICVAGSGYDGPSGVGTPAGISAFLPTGVASEEGATNSAPPPSPQPGTAITATPLVPPATTNPANPANPANAANPANPVELSGLALTLHALIALNRSRPSIAKLAFTFTLNVSARVQASLEKRVGRRGHQHWRAVARPVTIAGSSGPNSRRLSGREALGAGSYRLTLTPAGGKARSIVFRIG